MRKILILIFFIINAFATNIYIAAFKNCNSKNDKFYTKNNFFWLKKFLKNNHNKVFLLPPKGSFKIRKINLLRLEYLPNNVKSLKRLLTNLSKEKNLNNSFLIIFNSFEFSDDSVNVSTCNKTLNKSWITSKYSPYKCNIFNILSSNSLNGLKVAIIDNSLTNIFYLQNRKCFYYNFFNQLGAKLTYYGNPHSNIDLIFKSFNNIKEPNCKYYFNTLDSILMLNGKAVNYDFCSAE
jgi:hypothetical protein